MVRHRFLGDGVGLNNDSVSGESDPFPGPPADLGLSGWGREGRGVATLIVTWYCTENLVLDRDGILWLAIRDGEDGPVRHRRIGPIEDDPRVADSLEAEVAECLDLWRDAFDDRDEQLRDYRHP